MHSYTHTLLTWTKMFLPISPRVQTKAEEEKSAFQGQNRLCFHIPVLARCQRKTLRSLE